MPLKGESTTSPLKVKLQNNWSCSSVVILQTQVRDQVFAHDVAQGVLQFHRLNEQIVLWSETFRRLWRLEIKAQPLLDADGAQFWRSLGEVEEQHQVKGDWRGQDRIAAQEIQLDLHGIAEPSEDVDVI